MNIFGFSKPNIEKMKDEKDIKGLLKALKNKYPVVRERAIVALGETKDERAVKPLLKILKDKSPMFRVYAALALGNMGDKSVVEPLIKALKDKGSYVRCEVAVALGKTKDERAVKPLIESLKDNTAEVKEAAASALINIANVRDGEPLIQGLKNVDSGVRQRAAEILYKMKDKKAVQPLIQALKGQKGTIQREAAGAPVKVGKSAGEAYTLKREVKKLTERIYWQDGVCPVGEVDLKSEALARKVLLSLPIISLEDPRRNTDPATSTYFDYDDRVKLYSLDEASRNVYSYWVFRTSAQTAEYCEVTENRLGKELRMSKDYKYQDGSGGGRGFTVIRLDDNEFLFYGRDLEQWKASR